MSKLSENIDIDELLEQVALAMAKGDNQAATHLLPKIMASGDEIQRQMAQSYLMQLDALIAMEEEEEKLSEFIDFGEDSDDNIDIDSDIESDSESDARLDALDDVDEVIELEAVDSILDEIRSTAVAKAESKTEPVVKARTEESPATEVASMTAAEKVVAETEIIDEAVSHAKDEAKTILTLDDIADMEMPDIDFSEEIEPLEEIEEAKKVGKSQSLMRQELSAEEEQEKEYDIALEQAAMLIDDGEYGTAEMLLEAVFEGGSGTQLQMAEAYKMQIEQLSQIPQETLQSAQPATEPMDKSVDLIDTVDSVLAQQDTLQDIMPEELSNAPVELIDFIDEPTSTADADALFDVDSIFNNTSSIPEPARNFESRAFQAYEDRTDNEIGAGISITEQFNEIENTDDLLSPTAALGAFAFSGEDLLPKGGTAVSDEVVNQRQGFFVGDVGLMIDFIGGSELTEMPDYYAVPNAPSWLKGLTNLHGVIVPVFDLVQFLNLENKHKGKQMLLILQHHEKAVGVVVNGLPTRLTWRDSQRMEDNASPDNLSQYIDGAYLLGEQLWFDLDVDTLCTALERGLEMAA